MKVIMKNEHTGVTKSVKKGFSWTTLFFGCFVPLLRGDLKWALIMFLLAFISFGLSWLVMPFIYNGRYIEDLMSKGFKIIEYI